MTYIVEVTYADRPPVVFRRVSDVLRGKNESWIKIRFVDHSTEVYITLNSNVLFYSKFKDNEYEKKDTISSMPKRLACR